MSDRTYLEIRNRLNLRPPQAESLRILADLSDKLPFDMNVDAAAVLELLRTELPASFESFERDFPSFAFALATGVGMTRLMGAFIAYLHMKLGIKNFFCPRTESHDLRQVAARLGRT
jgi:type III restriction enzyme